MRLGIFEGEHHVIGVESLAVAPLGVGAQLPGDALEVFGDLIGHGQTRDILVRVPDILDP
jgi:hypothetical protein